MEIHEINTIGARRIATDKNYDAVDIHLNWWECFSNYRLKKWKQELRNLCKETGTSFEDVCVYMNMEVSKRPSFCRKLPKYRETYIGIGMAYKQPREVIDRWLIKYGMKRKLYLKDIVCDLIWIYLIDANYEDRETQQNYYQQFDICKAKLENELSEVWQEELHSYIDTVCLEKKFQKVIYDPIHIAFRKFVKENIDAFKAAYSKPRQLLKTYVEQILATKNLLDSKQHKWTLNSLRGYLDDSMINYLSGDTLTVNKNLSDGEAKNKGLGVKYVPRNRRAHISLCLAIGMGTAEIDSYFDMMGYGQLDAVDKNEGTLINMLKKWEHEHPLVEEYKKKYILNKEYYPISEGQELEAVNQMLQMRRDLKSEYMRMIQEEKAKVLANSRMAMDGFPYLKD